MNNKDDTARGELVKRIRAMSRDDLISYMNVSVFINRLVSLVGISCLFFMITFPSIFIIPVGIIIVYIVGNISTGMDIVIREIVDRLKYFDK